jgi:chaperonin GroES
MIPLKDRVLVEVEPPPTKIGGIFLPDSAITNRSTITGDIRALAGKVIAAGPGKRDDDGEFHPTEVKAGDLVWVSSRWNDLPKYSETMRLMQEADILGYRTR